MGDEFSTLFFFAGLGGIFGLTVATIFCIAVCRLCCSCAEICFLVDVKEAFIICGVALELPFPVTLLIFPLFGL